MFEARGVIIIRQSQHLSGPLYTNPLSHPKLSSWDFSSFTLTIRVLPETVFGQRVAGEGNLAAREILPPNTHSCSFFSQEKNTCH